jgi:hypothetical protein
LFGGARVIGVATGVASVDDLREAGAHAVVESLDPADGFVAALDRLIAGDQADAGA